MNILKKLSALTLILFVCFSFCPVYAQPDNNSEHILSYDSSIIVNKDSSLNVTESIKVVCQGKNIKRGIYRDFPTKYTDNQGKRIKVGFDVLSVKKDGTDEPYNIENISNGKRIYIGKSDVLLSPGVYTYTIEYKTTRQLGYFDTHDELYYNINGNGWDFSVDKITATVTLPSGINASDIKTGGYTGPQGSTEKDFQAKIDGNSVSFETNKPLSRFEGLTVVVGWPKGFVVEDKASLIEILLSEYLYVIAPVLGIIFSFLFFIFIWSKVGKDPEKGTIIPLYYPPENLTPSAVRYITKMQYDTKIFACSLINMAVKGFIKIVEEKIFFIKVFSINKVSDDESMLSAEEKQLAHTLLGSSDSFKFKQDDYEIISSAGKKLSDYLDKNYKNRYFKLNKGYAFLGALISIIGLVVGFFSLGSASSLFLSPVIIFISTAIIAFVIILIFSFLLKAPTKEGRELMDKIEGFKMYLSFAEKDELNYSAPVEMTPEIFEKYLPYALALDVENAWSERFATTLAKSMNVDDYHPAWYAGAAFSAHHIGRFASSFSDSLSSSISSSGTAPGSSSGFSGGSSGGGGGGGGGGGW